MATTFELPIEIQSIWVKIGVTAPKMVAVRLFLRYTPKMGTLGKKYTCVAKPPNLQTDPPNQWHLGDLLIGTYLSSTPMHSLAGSQLSAEGIFSY